MKKLNKKILFFLMPFIILFILLTSFQNVIIDNLRNKEINNNELMGYLGTINSNLSYIIENITEELGSPLLIGDNSKISFDQSTVRARSIVNIFENMQKYLDIYVNKKNISSKDIQDKIEDIKKSIIYLYNIKLEIIVLLKSATNIDSEGKPIFSDIKLENLYKEKNKELNDSYYIIDKRVKYLSEWIEKQRKN